MFPHASVPLARSSRVTSAAPIWPINPAQTAQSDPIPRPEQSLAHSTVNDRPSITTQNTSSASGPAGSRTARIETIYLDSSPIDEKCGLLGSTSRVPSPPARNSDSRPFGWFRSGWESRTQEQGRPIGGQQQQQQCCKELKGNDERHLINPAIGLEVKNERLIFRVIGLSDGLTVPFALTAGLSAIGSSRLVVSAGLAELIAGAISMGVGGYLASQAELDHFHYTLRQTRDRVARSCASEMEREVHAVLGPLGVRESLSRLIASDLRRVEDELAEETKTDAGGQTGGQGASREDVQWASSGIDRVLNVCGRQDEIGAEGTGEARSMRKVVGMIRSKKQKLPEMGLTAFLLKFGEGMEEVPRSRLYISALTIGLSYFLGGLIPLVPYIALQEQDGAAMRGLIISSAVTGSVLLLFGAFKTYFTGARGGIGGYLWGSISTLFVGGGAAVAAYFLVRALHVQE